MAVRNKIVLILILSCSFFSDCYSETNTLQQGGELKDWDQLVSSKKVFALKFFSFGISMSPYLGIFYKDKGKRKQGYPDFYDYPSDKAVWVANRDNPIPDTSGKLLINRHGRLSITYSGGIVVDLFKPAAPVEINASATLLDSGNFVLNELYPDGSIKRVLWESFDYPTDTLLPGMKLGINLKTGHKWSLTSWASDFVPATGSFKLTGDPNGSSQLVMLSRGNVFWMSGPWRNGQFENTDLLSSGPDVRLYYTSNEDGKYFTYLTKTYDTTPALTIYPNTQLKGTTLLMNVFCIRSFQPKEYYHVSDHGCVEYKNKNSECRATDDWSSQEQVETYGDGYEYDESYNLTLDDCWKICWNNCSCTAYTYTRENRTGCKVYSQIKHRLVQGDKADKKATMVYFIPRRYSYNEEKSSDAGKNRRWWIWLIILMGLFAPLSLCYVVRKSLHIKAKEIKKMILHITREIGVTAKRLLHLLREIGNTAKGLLRMLRENHATALSAQYREERKMKHGLQFFTFESMSAATNNFSSMNKLGEGGYGTVYKGKLLDGMEVAVKRLSRSSGQGVEEFTNETQLIANLQHTNLVRLLGYCIQKEEKILVYEYMTNNSLDFFLFDPSKKELLKWRNRFVIIEGIAQGLLYLHKYSRLRVIHRDLKASNILLDDCLNPKISDFGMAKLFGTNETEATTKRVVGTPGYISPEYMKEGTISTKTDVFSFGVLILEIISSKKNHGTYDVEHPLNLIGLAWELWKEGRGLELMDRVLEDSFSCKEVMTCIHVGLLCVQDCPTDRPSMTEVVSMLTNVNMQLPEPKKPAFFIQRHEAEEAKQPELDKLRNGSVNRQTISIVVAR